MDRSGLETLLWSNRMASFAKGTGSKKGAMKMRDWKKFENDEIMTIWKGYLSQEFGSQDFLNIQRVHPKPIRLTMMEIVKLVDELMYRLDIKENGNDIADKDQQNF